MILSLHIFTFLLAYICWNGNKSFATLRRFGGLGIEL